MIFSLDTTNEIGRITIDHPDRSMNVLDQRAMDELREIVDRLKGESLRGLVIQSGKSSNFIVGADLQVLRELEDEEHVYQLSRTGQLLFDDLSNLPYPTIGLIHGNCLGGGLELALACDYRIVSDDPGTELGAPEVKLGIIPGWGGTQRMPRLIGLQNALKPLLTGSTLSGRRAESLGLVDKRLPREHLFAEARTWIENDAFPNQPGGDWSNWPLIRTYVLKQARERTLKRTKGNMPGPLALLNVLQEGLAGTVEEGLKTEAEEFAALATTPECKNLIRVFFLRRDQKRFSLEDQPRVEPVERTGVIGAGTMGAGITHWVSSRDLPVALVDIDESALTGGMRTIDELYEKGVDAGAVTEQEHRRGMRRIRPGTEYDLFRACDLVIEAVVENMDVKTTVFNQLESYRHPSSFVATNTSALSLEEMAGALDNPSDVVGLHFFNPVYRMQLVEVVAGDTTSRKTLNRAVEFTKQIGKVPVVVTDTPGFLVNRILVPYLNEAGQLLEENHSIASIDEIMEKFGMPMGPLRLIDEVGIDVGHHVATYLIEELKTPYRLADPLRAIHSDGLTGTKGGAGFYRYGENDPVPNPDYVPDEEPSTDPEDIERRLVNLMIAEAVRCLEEKVVESADQLDVSMILGTGFAPFRGGLLRHADDYGLEAVVRELEEFHRTYGEPYRVPDRLRDYAETGQTFTRTSSPESRESDTKSNPTGPNA